MLFCRALLVDKERRWPLGPGSVKGDRLAIFAIGDIEVFAKLG
jgi:hypothetical protein